MTALSNSLVISKPLGSFLKSADQHIPYLSPTSLFFTLGSKRKTSCSERAFAIQASYGDGRRPSSAGIFVGGFVFGGLVAGTLSCLYAPQISKALAGADKDLKKKLPKFIYDEEKAFEKQRQKLAEKIEQLNSAIDNVSDQLQSDDPPNGAAVNPDEVESIA